MDSPQKDALLMKRLAEGDKAALGELVERHQRWVVEVAYRSMGNWGWAEDIGQEAFLRVWRSVDRYEPRAQFTTWLYRIVVNLCLDALKKRKPVFGDPPEVPDETGVSPSASLEARDRAAAVQQAVSHLPERQRVAVVLHRFSGLPIRKIAEITGWTESAVESLLVRAYAELRRKLKKLMES